MSPQKDQSSTIQKTKWWGKTTAFYWIDVGILLGFFTMVGTGLVISTWLNLSLSSYNAWRTAHIVSSIATLLVTVLKISLHWRWIAMAVRKAIPGLAASQARLDPGHDLDPRKPAPVPAAAGTNLMSRRQFLEVMGATSIASIFALMSAANSLQVSQAAEIPAATQAEVSQASSQTGTTLSMNSGSAVSDCTVNCPRGCAYPGHCRRYRDADGNGRCDFGECL